MAITDIPNFSAAPKVVTVNGSAEQWVVIKYGESQVDPALPDKIIEIRRVDMGDQFDLVEIAGSQVDNDVWLSLAIVALSVQTIDNIPVPHGALSKATLRNTLKQIGPLGVRAVRRALLEFDSGGSPAAGDQKAAAGN
jgi:hypothetical protein